MSEILEQSEEEKTPWYLEEIIKLRLSLENRASDEEDIPDSDNAKKILELWEHLDWVYLIEWVTDHNYNKDYGIGFHERMWKIDLEWHRSIDYTSYWEQFYIIVPLSDTRKFCYSFQEGTCYDCDPYASNSDFDILFEDLTDGFYTDDLEDEISDWLEDVKIDDSSS